jgi:hypothetical protein
VLGCKGNDQLAMNPRQCARRSIKPPFGERAKPETARSISPASRTLTALTSNARRQWCVVLVCLKKVRGV